MLKPSPRKDTIARSVVRQIIRAAHPFTSRERVSVVLFAYFDESGKPDHSPVVSLGAVVASERKWKKFETEWMKELYRVKAPIHPRYSLPYFHMTDFESRQSKDYSHLSKEEREEFISNLAMIVNKTIAFGAVLSLCVKDWNEIVMPHFGSYLQQRGWYLMLLQSALIEIAVWTKKLSFEEPIACVFDTNDETSYAAIEHFNDIKENDYWGIGNRFVSASYANSVQFCPLQAADMLAYEGRKDIHNKYIDGGERPLRKLLQVLMKEGRVNVSRFDREGLETFRDRIILPGHP